MKQLNQQASREKPMVRTRTLGDQVINGTDGDDKLVGGDGDDIISGGDGDDYIVDWKGQNLIQGGDGNDVIFGSGVIEGGKGNDFLVGRNGRSDDLYLFSAGDGEDIILEHASDSNSSKNDILSFEGIDKESLWFSRDGEDLKIQRLGSSDKVTILGWFSDSGRRIERIEAAGGAVLADSNVDKLVAAMAGFNPPAAGHGSLPEQAQQAIQAALAASWQ